MRTEALLIVALSRLAAASRLQAIQEVNDNLIEPGATLHEMSSNILKCTDPKQSGEKPPSISPEIQKVMEYLRSEVPYAGGLKTDGWKNRPFASLAISSLFPSHMVLGLVHNASKYTDRGPTADDNDCFDFNYDDPDAEDPSGCRVFEKSFKPLKELRQCIITHLERDEIWAAHTGRAWETARMQGSDDTHGFENASYKDWCDSSVYSYTYLLGINIPVRLCSSSMDTKRRAEEMIKFALFKRKNMNTKPQDVPGRVNKKIQQTTSWPGMKRGGQQSVSDATMDSISKECFKVRNDKKEEEYGFLQEISTCLPLMYDKTEIGDGFGFQDAYLKLSKVTNYGPPVGLKHHITYDVPPVCGRMALASLPNMQFARYHVTPSTWGLVRGEEHTAWSECTNPEFINCRKAYFCWEKALNLMCGIDSSCCPGGNEGQKQTYHAACMDGENRRCAEMQAE